MALNGHTLLVGTTDGLYAAEHSANGYTARLLGFEGRGMFRAAVLVDLGWLLHQEGSLSAAEVALRRAEQEFPPSLRGAGPAPAWAEIAAEAGLRCA